MAIVLVEDCPDEEELMLRSMRSYRFDLNFDSYLRR